MTRGLARDEVRKKADGEKQERAGEHGAKLHGTTPRGMCRSLDTSPPDWLHACVAMRCNQIAAEVSNDKTGDLAADGDSFWLKEEAMGQMIASMTSTPADRSTDERISIQKFLSEPEGE
ncbi:MAG: hypothetical protein WA374_17060 [Acidobacteriaceae bacterium]